MDDAAAAAFYIEPWLTGLLLALMDSMVIVGRIKSIGLITPVLVPVMILLYIIAIIIRAVT